MRIAYLDTIAGISGDMTLGAFVSAGVPLELLDAELRKLSVGGFELQGKHVIRNGIAAVKIDVIVSEPEKHHRDLRRIEEIITLSPFSDMVKERATRMFRELARAEARVHDTTIDDVHFHEVGATDAIVDIVGTAICLELIGVEQLFTSPVKLGSGGFVDTAHGRMPVPTPATVEILAGYPTILTDLPFELTTPTGATIVKSLSSGLLTTEQIKIERIGYGAGSKDFGRVPNLLRVFIGEFVPEFAHDDLVTVETNIDDMNPEVYPYLMERLFGAGAHDAYMVPVIMKKGRPGILVSVLTQRQSLDPILSVIFGETTTLGVRIQPVERRKLVREQREVKTSLGIVKVKVVFVNGDARVVPEYEECRRLALERKLPLMEVYGRIIKEIGS